MMQFSTVSLCGYPRLYATLWSHVGWQTLACFQRTFDRILPRPVFRDRIDEDLHSKSAVVAGETSYQRLQKETDRERRDDEREDKTRQDKMKEKMKEKKTEIMMWMMRKARLHKRKLN